VDAMSASDLPDMRPETSFAMARMLVKTMSCDQAVQARLREDFDHPPALRTIRRLRIEAALCAMPAPRDEPFSAHEGYWPTDASERAARTNRLFVERLRAAYPERFAA
jgi:hypothetical protein